MTRTSVLIIILMCIIPFSLYAGTTGKIAGVVLDGDTGDPLPGANVIIEKTNLGAATDLRGNYAILNVPPGAYKLKNGDAEFIVETTTAGQEVVWSGR